MCEVCGGAHKVKTEFAIIYDNHLHKPGLRTGWGFSALIETKDNLYAKFLDI
jgi:metal-dependent hydrolase (beta-lactamase superfamily II)